MVNYPEQWREPQNIKSIPDCWLNWGLQDDSEKIEAKEPDFDLEREANKLRAEEREADELEAEEEGKEQEPKEELETEL